MMKRNDSITCACGVLLAAGLASGQPSAESPRDRPTQTAPAKQPTDGSLLNPPTQGLPAKKPTEGSVLHPPVVAAPSARPVMQAPQKHPTSAAGAGLIFRTGFEATESPPYALGDLDGQNGWIVAPREAVGTVQDEVVSGGTQAVEIVDGGPSGHARVAVATAGIAPVLEASFDMHVGSGWATIPDEVSDRFEAHQRLELHDARGVPWGVEFGFVTTSANYSGIGAGQSALYIEVTRMDEVQAAGYEVVDAIDVLDGWHTYVLKLDSLAGRARLEVDGEEAVTVDTPTDFVSLVAIELQSQRWGTGPANSASLYFDDVEVLAAGCAPDVNGDGALDVLDFVAFQQAWQGEEEIADCDANGAFDVNDFVCFQQAFQEGCF